MYRFAHGGNHAHGCQGARQVDARRDQRKAKEVGTLDHRLRELSLYESGRDIPLAGFSPRKAATVVYGMIGFSDSEALRAKLGKHTTGGGCLYIKKLADVDQKILETLISKSVAAKRAEHAK